MIYFYWLLNKYSKLLKNGVDLTIKITNKLVYIGWRESKAVLYLFVNLDATMYVNRVENCDMILQEKDRKSQN
jgi:hypothetical protein